MSNTSIPQISDLCNRRSIRAGLRLGNCLAGPKNGALHLRVPTGHLSTRTVNRNGSFWICGNLFATDEDLDDLLLFNQQY